MKKIILILAVFLSTATGIKAQTGQQTQSCMENLSLFDGYVRSGNFADALPFWKKAYEKISIIFELFCLSVQDRNNNWI